jgi:hypothetical protein
VPRLARLLVRDPGGLGGGDRALLDRLRAASPMAATADPLLRGFARMVEGRTPEPLDARLAAAGCDVPHLLAFAEGLRRE